MAEFVASHGARRQPARALIRRLATGWVSLDELVRDTATPRRSVETLLTGLGHDLERGKNSFRIAPHARERYADLAESRGVALGDPLAPLVREHQHLLTEIAASIEEVPPPLAALDHVQATAETVLRRALWMGATYELDGAHLVLLGDHDLTSLAVHALHPRARITVLDIDDRLLAYLDERSQGAVRVLHGDLRFGLPRAVSQAGDLVFSDPPYTPEGMALFATRAVECLADLHHGRILLAYGYSPLHPTLGANVQRALLTVGLGFEAVLPDFHRYVGAQAVGSAADLYVCRPTPGARKAGGSGRGKKSRTGIYTHGPQAVESASTEPRLREELIALAEGGGAQLDGDVRGPDWTAPLGNQEPEVLAFDLSGDPGPWLLRLLLARNASRLALLVPNNHPDLADAVGQQALRELVQAKYRLRLLRSTPDPKHAVVVADRVPTDEQDLGARARHDVLSKAHGKLGNVLRDALSLLTEASKNDARAKVSALAASAGIREHELDLRLIDLPRHRIRTVLDALR